jgi:protein TonB
MIRIFSPSTRDGLLRPDAVTTVNFLVHVAVGVLLSVPLGHAVESGLADRLVVYLVPPDQAGARDRGPGQLPWRSSASAAGETAGRPAPFPDSDPVTPRGAAPAVEATEVEAATRLLPGDNALTVLEVDSVVARDPASAAPEYPPRLLAQGVEGYAAVRWVVDSTGAVDTLTYRVVQANHPDFAVAVRQALPRMRFRPAIREGHRVRQLVEQTFRFKITPGDTVLARIPL